MSYGVWQATIVNSINGLPVPGAMVSVKIAGTSTDAVLFEDREGLSGLLNPFPADLEGFARFYCATGLYDIYATSGGFGAEWLDVVVSDGGLWGDVCVAESDLNNVIHSGIYQAGNTALNKPNSDDIAVIALRTAYGMPGKNIKMVGLDDSMRLQGRKIGPIGDYSSWFTLAYPFDADSNWYAGEYSASTSSGNFKVSVLSCNEYDVADVVFSGGIFTTNLQMSSGVSSGAFACSGTATLNGGNGAAIIASDGSSIINTQNSAVMGSSASSVTGGSRNLILASTNSNIANSCFDSYIFGSSGNVTISLSSYCGISSSATDCSITSCQNSSIENSVLSSLTDADFSKVENSTGGVINNGNFNSISSSANCEIDAFTNVSIINSTNVLPSQDNTIVAGMGDFPPSSANIKFEVQTDTGNIYSAGIVAAQAMTINGSTVVVRQNNLLAITDPTVDDGAGLTYVPLSLWINTASEQIFICVDNTPTAAVWKSITQKNGTFTPFIEGSTTAGSATYSVQSGSYTKMDGVTNFTIELAWTGHTGTGDMILKGLPFTSGSNSFALSVFYDGLVVGTGKQLCAKVVPASTEINFTAAALNGGAATVPQIDADVTSLIISGFYFS